MAISKRQIVQRTGVEVPVGSVTMTMTMTMCEVHRQGAIASAASCAGAVLRGRRLTALAHGVEGATTRE